mgnify:FL=1
MKLSYAFRRTTFYPYHATGINRMFGLPSGKTENEFLSAIKDLGFTGIELGIDIFDVNKNLSNQAKELKQKLQKIGLECVAFRAGGGLSHPKNGNEMQEKLLTCIDLAGIVEAEVVNTALVTPFTDPDGYGISTGERISQGSSVLASDFEFNETANKLQQAADHAKKTGVNISVEVHQHSIVDNSWSALHMVNLVNRENFGINPDLGNIYWNYDEPEETCEEAIVELAPKSLYWHCKNLKRVHIPELEKSIFLQAPLPDGDIDYRFAINAMKDANYSGYLAVEGMREGDALSNDKKSLEYVRSLID